MKWLRRFKHLHFVDLVWVFVFTFFIWFNMSKKVLLEKYGLFLILLIVTAIEVILGIIKPPFMIENYIIEHFIKYDFIILTIVKAYYIVYAFMHLGSERKNLNFPYYY